MATKTNRERIEEARHQLVARDNDLIQKGRYGLSLVQQKCVLYCISKVKPTDAPDTEYDIDLHEFYRLLGYKSDSYTGMKTLWQQIGSVRWWLDGETEEDDDILLGWFTKVHLNERSSSVTITFHPDIYPYIHNLVADKEKKKYFTTYQLQNITLMKHRYSIRIYDLLKSYQYNNKIWQFEMGTGSHHDLMRRISDCDEKGKPLIPKSWDNYSFFNRDVLQPAVDEINQYTDIKIAYEVSKTDLSGKKHRRYASILFAMVEKSPAEKRASQEQITQELDLPLEENVDDLFADFFAQHEAILKEEGVFVPEASGTETEACEPGADKIWENGKSVVDSPEKTWETTPEKTGTQRNKKVAKDTGSDRENAGSTTYSHRTEVDVFEVCSKAASILKPLSLSASDILTIAQTADYDLEKIQQAYDVLKSNKGKINDVVSWLISAIKNGYRPRNAVPYQAAKKNSFTDYEQRTYDYDDLMEKIRRSQH